jgi:thiamine biosynthesis lipoprotein
VWIEHRGRGMGTDVQIVVADNDAHLLDAAIRRLADLERRWSRFLPTSELSRLNSHAGVPVIVSEETFDLVAMAVNAWRDTGGLFDPTVHDAVVAHGYDRSYDQMGGATDAPGGSTPTPTPVAIDLDETMTAITLPRNVRLDLGGIGKGAAADLIVTETMAAGARAVCVNIGGDVRACGPGPARGHWPVVLRCPGSREARTIELTDGAVCTSTRLRRRWINRGTPAHHLIDPATGCPAFTGVASVGVIAAGAAQSEVLAKTAYLAGPAAGLDLLHRHGVDGVIVTDDGMVHAVGPLVRLDA